MSTLVTGAGGFIGAAAVEALRAVGCDVRAGVRRGAGVLCDLDRPETLGAALADIDLVVHAAYGDVAAMPGQMRALLDAMSAAGVRHLVYLSSIAVYGAAEGALDESAAPGAALDAYGAAKVDCERQAREWAQAAPERRAVLLRPGVVYGAGSRFWTVKLAERIRAGAWGDFGARAQGHAALIHVDDLAAMIVGLAERLRDGSIEPHCLPLNAVGPERPSWGAYFEALARQLGAPSPPRWSETQLRRRLALSLPAKLWRRLGLPGFTALALAPTSGELALFSRRAIYQTNAARAIGIEARIGLEEGLRRTGVG